MANSSAVPKLYQSVVDDVINNVRESFLDDGVDEQVLMELKQLWENKLIQTKVLHQDPPQPVAISQQPKAQPAQVITQQVVAHAQPHAAAAFQAQQHPVMTAASQGLMEMSGAAQTATLALQPQLMALQGQTITLSQGGQQFIIAPSQQLVTQQRGAIPSGASFIVNPQQPTASTTDPQTIQRMVQLDGANDSSSDDDDDDDDDGDDKDDDEDQNDEDNDQEGEEEESLNSNDDVSSEEDQAEVFDTESVVVCQFDKINRNKNKWKFHLKDGIMNLNGKDYVFQKATGEAEW